MIPIEIAMDTMPNGKMFKLRGQIPNVTVAMPTALEKNSRHPTSPSCFASRGWQATLRPDVHRGFAWHGQPSYCHPRPASKCGVNSSGDPSHDGELFRTALSSEDTLSIPQKIMHPKIVIQEGYHLLASSLYYRYDLY